MGTIHDLAEANGRIRGSVRDEALALSRGFLTRAAFRIFGLLGLSVGLRCARDMKSPSSRAVPLAIRNRRSAAYGSASPRPPHQCATCGSSVLTAKTGHAHAGVMKLDAALLHGKRLGAIDGAGLGRLSWPDSVAPADVLMGTYWTAVNTRERRDIYQRMVRNRRTGGRAWHSRAYGDRYHGLGISEAAGGVALECRIPGCD